MSELLQRLRQANRTLSAAIVLLNAPARAGIGITPEQLAGVLSELLRVGEWLQRKAVPQNDPEVAVAVQQYRESLQQLQSLLPAPTPGLPPIWVNSATSNNSTVRSGRTPRSPPGSRSSPS